MSDKLINKINKKVKKYWGYDSLKDKQMEIITNFIKKKRCNWTIAYRLW